MSNSIGSNIKTIIRQSIAIPLELTSVVVEVAADATNVLSSTIRGTVPTTKQLGAITGHFVVGAANSDLTEEQLNVLTKDMSFGKIMDDIAAGSGSAGQSSTKAVSKFFAED